MCAFVITYFGGNLSLAWLSHKRLCKLSYILALCYKSTTHNQVNYVKKQKQVTSHIYFLVWLLCCTWIIIQTKTKIHWFHRSVQSNDAVYFVWIMRFLCPAETADFCFALTKVPIITICSATTYEMEAITYYMNALLIAKGTCIQYQGQFHHFKNLREMQIS